MTIVLRSLVVRSSSTTLVSDVTLRLTPASRTALVGTSGAGKSPTYAAFIDAPPASLEVADSLTVELDGASASSDPSASSLVRDESGGVNLLGLPTTLCPRGSRITLVPQDHSTALYPLIAVGHQIALASQAAGHIRGEARQHTTDYPYAVGLDESFADRIPGHLSGGQRQCVSLTLTLVAEPVLIVTDEPTTTLDVVACAEILGLLSSLIGLLQALVLFLITYDLPTVTVCENAAVLHDGVITESRETPVVLTRPAHPVTATMCGAGIEETIDGALATAGAAA